ncbi:MAG: hypothetical protein MJZ01_01150 [Bacteroidales bacterium]|nr:hypothetical protein [Bacteroidales bacterium]
MANKRTLKKAIRYWVNDLITTLCYKGAVADAETDKVSNLIVKTMALQNEFLARVNHVDQKSDKKAVKAYFSKFNADFTAQVTSLAEEINKI